MACDKVEHRNTCMHVGAAILHTADVSATGDFNEKVVLSDVCQIEAWPDCGPDMILMGLDAGARARRGNAGEGKAM